MPEKRKPWTGKIACPKKDEPSCGAEMANRCMENLRQLGYETDEPITVDGERMQELGVILFGCDINPPRPGMVYKKGYNDMGACVGIKDCPYKGSPRRALGKVRPK